MRDHGITWHNMYKNGKGGYDAAIRVVAPGGLVAASGDELHVTGADEVLVLMRIVPWKTPLSREKSEAWA